MKAFAIAAIALAGLTLPTAPAQADGSNCTAWNGPYCETAHNIRHHGWRLPVVWAQPYPHWQQPWHGRYDPYHSVGYPLPQPYPVATGCVIPSVWSCRRQVPLYGGAHY